MGFEGRAVVVTGATGGLGEVVVGSFLDAGAHVAAQFRDEARAEELRAKFVDAGDRFALTRVDPADERAMHAFAEDVVARWGRIDAVAILAGGFAAGAVLETTVDDVQALFDQNVRTALVTIRATLPHLRARAYGRIVCVGARSALRGGRNTAGYAIAKTGVVRLVESLAEEVRDEGITVNAVLPSAIDNPTNRARYPKTDPSTFVQPQELAAVIAFLCSEEASGVTGAAIPVFGRM